MYNKSIIIICFLEEFLNGATDLAYGLFEACKYLSLVIVTLIIDPASVFPISSKPFGLSYGEWSAKWWQWMLSIPRANSPALDYTGERASINQQDSNVFFLCQTYEGVESVPSRKVTIPRGKAIFIPIINWVSLMHHDGETDEELSNVAKQRMDVVANLEITINGVRINEGLEKYRSLSPFFDAILPDDNIAGVPAGMKRAISDGYWVFLKPQDNAVKLNSFGSCSSGVTKIGVNYQILLS